MWSAMWWLYPYVPLETDDEIYISFAPLGSSGYRELVTPKFMRQSHVNLGLFFSSAYSECTCWYCEATRESFIKTSSDSQDRQTAVRGASPFAMPGLPGIYILPSLPWEKANPPPEILVAWVWLFLAGVGLNHMCVLGGGG